MNIKILDSWIREYLKTRATPKEFAKAMSLTSVSIERVEKHGADFVYDIEVTTNRIDVASVIGLAREAGAVLPQFGIPATFMPPKLKIPTEKITDPVSLTIQNNDRLVNRICAVVMEVNVKDSPKIIKERLETSDIRSINNIVDVTNYVMRVIGHPTHVFDYDLLKTKTLVIRESRNKERIKTLDGKEYVLTGGDIVAEDGIGNIVDLLGVMGLENSVVNEKTKRIVYFIDNVDAQKIRKTSMQHGIRTEAAQLNEKTVDPNASYDALLFGIELYKQIAGAKLISNIIDIYPNKPKEKTVTVPKTRINSVIDVDIPERTILQILSNLGFTPSVSNEKIDVLVPSYRSDDISIPEDIIEEIARVYGYHNIPNSLPPVTLSSAVNIHNDFFWETRVKNALKYWGFVETYTYPIVSETMYEGPIEDAVTLSNPLGEEFAFMRETLVPNLLQVVEENKNYDSFNIFEIGNVYKKKLGNLPEQIITLAGVVKQKNSAFYRAKGSIEQLLSDIGINDLQFKPSVKGGLGASVSIGKEYIGEIEVLDDELVNFELNFQKILACANNKKIFTQLAKHPAIIEDITCVFEEDILTGDIIETIITQSKLVKSVNLITKYKDTKTFRILYQDPQKNLTTDEVAEIRGKIVHALVKKHRATLK